MGRRIDILVNNETEQTVQKLTNTYSLYFTKDAKAIQWRKDSLFNR